MTRFAPVSVLALFALAPSCAHAESLQAQIRQVFAGMQIASISASDVTTTPALNDSDNLSYGDHVGDLSQAGTNVSNVLSAPSTPVNNLSQTLRGQQIVLDLIKTKGSAGALQQNGLNISNAASGITLAGIIQYMDDSGRQAITNRATINGKLGQITQSGINAANLLFATTSIDSAGQAIAPGAVQRVDNILRVAGGGHSVTQTGTNIGNAVIADKVDNVTRVFRGEQIVDNVLNFGSGPMPFSIAQSGLNVANYVSARDIGTLNQISTGSQVIKNSVVDGTLQAYTASTVGGTLTQQSNANYVNVVSVTGGKTDGQTLSISQTAQFTQTNSVSGGGSTQAGNVVSINR
jgi:hypothetical protein